MTGARLVALLLLVLTTTGCSAQHSARPHETNIAQAPVALRPTPSGAFAICRRLSLIRATCPRRVPVGLYAHARPPPGYIGVAAGGAIATCGDNRMRGVPLTSSACASQTWILEVGAPAGLPPDAPPGLPGKRIGPSRSRPPQYVHIIIYIARGSLAAKFPFTWPQGPAQRISDGLLRPDRKAAIFLGRRDWAEHRGTLILAPPLIFGGENGDHLIFRWRHGDVDDTVSLHSWAPLTEAVSTLKAVVRSAAPRYPPRRPRVQHKCRISPVARWEGMEAPHALYCATATAG